MGGDVAKWGQLDAPSDATAVFPADSVPSSHDGADLTGGGYTRAELHYLDASGRSVNTAEPGKHISTTEYDRYGNTVRELSAANRALALGTTDTQKDALTGLGIISRPSAERAHLLSTTSLFDEAGTRELEEFGPLHRVDLTENLKAGPPFWSRPAPPCPPAPGRSTSTTRDGPPTARPTSRTR